VSERVTLTVEEAIAMLAEGEIVHTFRGGNGIILGADWNRADVLRAICETDRRELSGELATAMKHGLCINSGGPLFIATRDV
jgi:hypothetical protein